jgi:putative peptidoglycan lipid II flippase
LAFFTLGSQLFALARDRLLAHQFGTGETLDIFYAAFRIPDTMYAILASTVSLFVLIPFLEKAERKGLQALQDFLSNMFSFFSGALVVFATVAWVVTPQLVHVLYGTFSPLMQEELVSMVHILLLQPLLLGISNLFAAYVQIRGRFLLYAVAPILYNVGIILGIVVLYPKLGTAGLAWGVVLGACLHLGVQTPYIIANGMLPSCKIPDWKSVCEVVRVSIPRTITLSAQQLVTLVLISIASHYAAGSVSAFSFAINLQAVPLAIIGVSYSVAAFPKLSRLFGSGETSEYVNLILVASRQIIFWALPTIAFFVILRAQIVRIVLGTGEFDWSATRMTAAILALLTISLVAQSLMVLLVRACYAAGKTKVPLVINVTSSVATIFFAFTLLGASDMGLLDLGALAKIMRVEGVLSPEILLLAVAYSLGAIINMILLLVYFERAYSSFVKGLVTTAWQSLVASLVGGYGTYLTLNLLTDMVSLDTFFGIVKQGTIASIVGCCLWIVTLVTLGNSDVIAAWTTIQKRLSKNRVKDARGSIESLQ